ncbi:MAG: MCE family protein [Hyphomicrobiales bacterium]|nr:MCE family protein [Hyphomicrobiales bacterium]
METRANYALIGAFTLGVIAAAFLFVYWFAGPARSQARTPYDVIFTGSVSGLSKGASVNFNGIRVGDVTRLSLNKDEPSQVIARIDVDRSTPINSETKARLETQGLTGVAAIALSSGGPNGIPLPPDQETHVPVLPGEPSQIQNLLEVAQRIADQVGSFTEKANSFIDQNSGSIAATVRNAETLTGSLALSLDQQKLQQIVDNINRSSANLDKVVANANTAVDNANAILAPARNQIRTLSVDIGGAAQSIRKLSDNLDMRLKDISVNIARFTGPGLRQYEALGVDARKTLEQVNRTVRSLQKDPSQVIFGAKPQIPEYSGK